MPYVQMTPGKDYLGVACAHCGWEFAIVGPLDVVQIPPDKPFRLGSRGPVLGDCPHCGKQDNYPIEQVHRVQSAPRRKD
jgi:rubredoxin